MTAGTTGRVAVTAGELKAGWRRFLLPAPADVVFAIAFTFAISLGSVLTNRDGDLGVHLATGSWMLEHGAIPTTDVFSHTAASHLYAPHEWISQVLFTMVERAAGFDGIGLLSAATLALPWAILTRWLLRRNAPLAATISVVLLGAATSVVHWAARPHAFTLALLALWMIMLEDFRTRRRSHLWALIPLTALWSNLHAGFLAGLGLLILYLIGSIVEHRGWTMTSRHLCWVTLASAAASLLNPIGARQFVVHWEVMTDEVVTSFTDEWLPPDFGLAGFWPFLAMMLMSLLMARQLAPTPLLVTAAVTVLALMARRNVAVYAVVAVPLLVQAVQRRRAGGSSPPSQVTWHRWAAGGTLAAVVVAGAGLEAAASAASPFGFDAARFPVAAMRSLGSQPPGNKVFNQFEWGGYLMYCCSGEVPVFIDGRSDVYLDGLLADYATAIDAHPGWPQVLARYDVDWVLVSPGTPLASALVGDPAWRGVYEDETAVAFSREPNP